MTDYYDHIDDYINGLLTGEERAAFKAAMAKDAGLAAAVENHDVAMDVIGSMIEDEVRGVIGEVESGDEVASVKAENDAMPKKGKIRWMRVLSGAAAACLIGCVGYWAVGKYQYGQLEEEIFAHYFENSKPLNGGVRGELTTNHNVLDSIIYYFDLNENEKSLELIQSTKTIADKEAVFKYKMHNLFMLEDYDQIIIEANSQNPYLTNEIRELVIYSLLLENKNAEAKLLLGKLSFDQQQRLITLI